MRNAGKKQHQKLQQKHHKPYCGKSLEEAFTYPDAIHECGCSGGKHNHGDGHGHGHAHGYEDTHEDDHGIYDDTDDEGLHDVAAAAKARKNKKKKEKKLAKQAAAAAAQSEGGGDADELVAATEKREKEAVNITKR